MLLCLCLGMSLLAEGGSGYKGAPEFLASFPGAVLESKAEGDLNGDGRPDWVLVVRREYGPPVPDGEARKTRQVFILLQTDSGDYRLAETSTEHDSSCGTSYCSVDGLEVKKNSAFLNLSIQWHDCASSTRYQFKAVQGVWRLIGILYRSTRYNKSHDIAKSFEIDKNLLTGEQIVRDKTGNSAAIVRKTGGTPETYYLKDYGRLPYFGLDELDYQGDPCQ